MTDTHLVLCGEPSPIGNTNACPQEKDHDGEHYCWGEAPHGHDNSYGVTVMTFSGERVMHMTMIGPSEPETVCAVIGLTEVLARRPPDEPHEPIRGGVLHPPCCPQRRGSAGGS